MPKVKASDGVELHYYVDDFRDPWAPETDEAIFMHHGYARSGKWWIQWVPGLSRKYKVIRNDCRGCGQSDVPPQRPPVDRRTPVPGLPGYRRRSGNKEAPLGGL